MLLHKWVIIILALLLTGCSSIGPKQINLDRGRYNDVIRDTNNTQLLANIVRIRYVEPMFFMKLSNVTASYALEPQVNTNSGGFFGITDTTGSVPLVTRQAFITPGALYADRPTISYTPVEDSEFANHILQPISLEKLQLLFAGGIDEPLTLMRLVVQQINDFDNASAASSAKLPRLPVYKDYYRFLGLLEQLYQEGNCGLFPEKISSGHYSLGVHFTNACLDSPTARALKRMLDVPENSRDIVFTTDPEKTLENNVFIRLRSLYGMMTYLSYGVQIPEADLRANYVYTYYDQNGCPFDWTPLMQGLMNISSSNTEPCDVFVKAYVHNHWFYIKNSDLDSKATFTLLARLMALAAGKDLGGTGGPVLTLPA